MTTKIEVQHCTVDDIGLRLSGKDAIRAAVAIDDYLKQFAFHRCPGCNAKLDGVFGTYAFGATYGEGFCRQCDWPCRALHYPAMDGKRLFKQCIEYPLPYHPDYVTGRKSDD